MTDEIFEKNFGWRWTERSVEKGKVKKLATNRKLGRTTDIRMAMLKNLTTDLLVHGKVETTLPRAKEVKAIADSLISLGIKEKDDETSRTRWKWF